MIDICLSQAKDKTNQNIAVLGALAVIIIMKDYCQFSLVIK